MLHLGNEAPTVHPKAQKLIQYFGNAGNSSYGSLKCDCPRNATYSTVLHAASAKDPFKRLQSHFLFVRRASMMAMRLKPYPAVLEPFLQDLESLII